MSLTQKELKDIILESTPRDFCRKHLFNQDVHIFDDSIKKTLGIEGSYHDFKCAIGDILNTTPNNISIVGSAKVGFSMNPTKTLTKFHSKSDIDLVIASPEIFEDTWSQLRKSYYSNQTAVRTNHANDLFSKFLVVNEKLNYQSINLRDVVTLIQTMKKDIARDFRIKRVINYRIYANWKDVEDYHEFGITILKNSLNGPRGDKI